MQYYLSSHFQILRHGKLTARIMFGRNSGLSKMMSMSPQWAIALFLEALWSDVICFKFAESPFASSYYVLPMCLRRQ